MLSLLEQRHERYFELESLRYPRPKLKEPGVKQVYIWCDKGNHLIRVDDGSLCEHYAPPARNTESTMTIFRGPGGKISIPWDPSTPCPPGYTLEQVRGARAVRKLEKELDAKDIKRHQQFQEKLQRLHAPSKAQRREDLKQIVRDGVTTHEGRTIRVSEFGREMARQALQRSEQKYSQNYEPGNYRRE